ncbi:hypothetical protein ASF92_13700 [Pedobacter sp. Leaf176]|nr:hypothetical protein ASF92_13700 [Pedobacter sp. Leaf176]
MHKNIYLFFAEVKVYQALFKNEMRLVLSVLYSLGAFFLLDLTRLIFKSLLVALILTEQMQICFLDFEKS